jgi:poly(A) polymerase
MLDLPGVPAELLLQLQHLAEGRRLALVGGAVRDGLLHREHRDPWRGLPDLDLVLEGSAPSLAEALRRHLGPERVPLLRAHGAYGTVELEVDGVLLDLASARREHYGQPGENPQVLPGSLEEDLARRDFSVNAMALLLGPQEQGHPTLLDPYGGRNDLAHRALAFLHSRSVADDPTRVIRAARYAARLNFALTPAALQQVHSTLSSWPWGWRLGDDPSQAPPALATRLRMELELLLERERWQAGLPRLQQWGALRLLDEGVQGEPHLLRRLRWGQRLGLPLMVCLVAAAADPIALAARLQLPKQHQRWLAELLRLQVWLNNNNTGTRAWSAARWTQLLEGGPWSAEAVALAVSAGGVWWRPLLRWWGRWRSVRAPLAARQLIEEGWSPGPQLGEELRRLRLVALEGMR